MRLSLVEQETIIIFNRFEDEAYVFTYDPVWQRHMESLGCKQVESNGIGGKEYQIDKHRIPKPRLKRKGKAMSEEQKVIVSERFRKARAGRKKVG